MTWFVAKHLHNTYYMTSWQNRKGLSGVLDWPLHHLLASFRRWVGAPVRT